MINTNFWHLMKEFIGRKQELKHLEWYLKKKSSSLIVVKGRRRIGKTRLIEEFAKNQAFYSFSGLAPTKGVTSEDQRKYFVDDLKVYFGIETDFKDWMNIFRTLAELTTKGRVIISFDEISWMASYDPTFLPKLKEAWDRYFSQNPKLILILCGSISHWIDQNILSSTGFLGRISYTLNLGELPLNEVSLFWKNKKSSSYEIFKILSVTGGVPLYLESVEPLQTAEENIARLCFYQGGLLTKEFTYIFSDLFSKRSTIYKDIVMSLVTGAKTLEEIRSKTNFSQSGKLSDYINHLELSGFVRRHYNWDLKSGKKSKLSKINIADNYIRFYLKYVEKEQHRIQNNNIEFKLASLVNWHSIMGLQFEALVLTNKHLILQLLQISFQEIINDGPYFQKQTKLQSACQIDYLIQTKFNILYLCEIKFSKNPVGKKAINEIEEKIKRLKLPRGFSCKPVLVHVNGVTEELEDEGYFAHIIDFGEFLKQ